MVSSMTAFAREEYRGDEGELVWELRSVNHRYLETYLRLPEELRSLEPLVRESVTKRLGRGKVECNLRFRARGQAEASLQVNKVLAKQLMAAGEEVAALLGRDYSANPMEILRWPGVLEEPEQDLSPAQKHATELLTQAIDSLIETRLREGGRLAEIITQRCESMRTMVAEARERMPEVMVLVRERIKNRLEEVMDELDEPRLEQEMALLAQKLDVDEEMDRLSTHLDEVERVMKSKGPIGRRLDFLMQELNRESNTLGSKSSDVQITRIAVEMKVLIEQMREQIQNIE